MSTYNIPIVPHSWVKIVDIGDTDFLVTWDTPTNVAFAATELDEQPTVDGHQFPREKRITREDVGTGYVWAKLASTGIVSSMQLVVSKTPSIVGSTGGFDMNERVHKVAMLVWNSSLLSWERGTATGGTDGTKIGKIQADLLTFVGDTLVTSQSVYIDNVLGADSNRVEFYDDGNAKCTNPYTAAGTLNFNSVLVGAGSSYRLMYSAPTGAGNDYGEAGAITVLKADNTTPITGTISASIGFDFDYDNSTAGGTAGTDKAVTLIGIRPGYGKFAVATGTLSRSKGISLSLVAEADRVYA